MGEDLDLIMSEVEVLNKLDHPYIVNHMETYDDKKFVYIGKSSKSQTIIWRQITLNPTSFCSYGVRGWQRVVLSPD